jgi:hypothetical protein
LKDLKSLSGKKSNSSGSDFGGLENVAARYNASDEKLVKRQSIPHAMSSDFLAQTSPMKSKDKILSAHNLVKLKRSEEDEVADSLDSGITPPKLQSVSSFGAPNSGKLAVASPIKKFNSALKKKSLKSEHQTSARGRPRAN